MNAEPDSWEPGGLLLGDYRVERHLGSGGMGHVVLARSQATREMVAIKRAQATTPEARRRLQDELRAWIDLPEFPHLVACRFGRTVGDDLAIFTEYVAGGSLADWLAAGRARSLPTILDIAIQTAWGLHAAHLLGVVHRDVKPSNVLLTPDGVAKLADFGLASAAWGVAGVASLTRGYCSPEQADRAAGSDISLTAATDQWSWGVTVLEMFTGSPPCRYGGQLAATVLESFLDQGGQEPGRPRLPDLLVEVLRKCFQKRPADRWATLADVADVVGVVYQLALGEPYPRVRPEWPTPAASQERSRRTLGGAGWDDPLDWLRRVLRAAGENPKLAQEYAPARGGSRRVQAIADLTPYDEALRRLTQLVAQGRADLTALLAELCLAKALAHWAADDVPGTARLAEHAVRLLEPLEAERPELLVEAYLRAATCARVRGRLPEALALAERGKAVCERAGAPDNRRLGHSYMLACEHLARTCFLLEDYPAARAALDLARAMMEDLITLDGRADLEALRADLYVQTARVLRASGEPTAALAWLDRAVPLLERPGSDEQPHALAAAYLTRARLLAAVDEVSAAERDCARSLEVWRDLLAHADRPDVLPELAEAQALQASLLVRQDRPNEAVPLYEAAQTLLERLVGPLGQHQHIPSLVRVYLGHAQALLTACDSRRARSLSEYALALLEPLVVGDRADLASDLAWCHTVHARSLLALGDDESALACLRAAVVLYEELVQARGRWDLLASLLRAYRTETLTLTASGHMRTAHERLDHALLVGQGLAESRETAEVVLALADLRIDRGTLLAGEGQVPQAQAELCEVVLRLEHVAGADEHRGRALRVLETLW